MRLTIQWRHRGHRMGSAGRDCKGLWRGGRTIRSKVLIECLSIYSQTSPHYQHGKNPIFSSDEKCTAHKDTRTWRSEENKTTREDWNGEHLWENSWKLSRTNPCFTKKYILHYENEANFSAINIYIVNHGN